ncbi:M20 aminoacylase family protein [Telmatospirillum siberiense]|uniref:Amidohydrolase n=1 Tax=Telmatospirillum siberiense TaxID=382514 RepID=A0A2N3PXL4_9PROT|nr:M20 aminoacylase family protein [Telmatospirillum siberiense]PKU25156.1 amidohydrolase [Telmatospirillum siberiense]
MTVLDDDILKMMTGWRHDLHAHPETAFTEIRTGDLVAAQLAADGYAVHRGLGQTGVVGTLSTGSGPVIGLRADMDALFIEEKGDLPYASRIAGKMHACGHDGHTVMLLGAARQLARRRNFQGTIHVIFQPAEENEGGGRRMIEDGLFDLFPCSEIFGLHNWPALPLGSFAINGSTMMAAFDTFEITVTGRGCHGAMPETGIDPIVVAAQIVLGLQTVVSRRVSPLEKAVLSVTQIHGGDTWNVIPDSVVLRGTVRCMSPEVQRDIEGLLRGLSQSIAAAHGAVADVVYEHRYPATINASASADKAARAAEEVVGRSSVTTDCPPSMASEDFGYMLQRLPGAYIFMGVGDDGHRAALHNPIYDFNDGALATGAAFWVRLVERVLPG